MIYFDKVDVKVNNSGLLAESVTVESQNEIQPAYVLGKKGILNQVPEGPIETTFNISYYVKLDQEPVFAIVNELKNLTGSYTGVNIEVAGCTGFQSYLVNYNLRSLPNELVKATANFITYTNLSGSLRESPQASVTGISGNLAIGWTTHVVSGNSYLTSPIYELEYSFDANWAPTYILGQSTPCSVEMLNGQETITVVRDVYKHIQFTGEEACEGNNALIPTHSNDKSIDILSYSFIGDNSITTPVLTIDITGFRIKTINLEAKIDDWPRTVTNIIKNY